MEMTVKGMCSSNSILVIVTNNGTCR